MYISSNLVAVLDSRSRVCLEVVAALVVFEVVSASVMVGLVTASVVLEVVSLFVESLSDR